MPEYLTIKEAAATIRISIAKMYQIAHSREGKKFTVKYGGGYRVHADKWKAFLDKGGFVS